jgi:hypothetical protein
MSLNTQRYSVSIQINGTDLITTQDATVDAALSQMLKFPLPVETIAQFKDHIPLPSVQFRGRPPLSISWVAGCVA